ncbi:hypothetical protein L207DRAFT_506221 [Hyaloscypha variabilis F]|uniref:Copper acquisition factor BIM1-like domain-containing protein n=1 Tax=Hyaloscypha variabilis (strain UAMH 11265 / GT02V1 / F) TaxID=1149755 RepID=A0A2J6S8W8_HYAVF|nr:hypothetical protein L207DRAFT_506221 [Hyaloscypha variabilis F]
MMGASKPFSLLLVMIASFQVLVSAHTQIWYPPWRNNSFNTPFSQQIYPCAGIIDTPDTNRTLWPLTGGSLNVTLHDGAAIIFVNLGLGVNVTNFNISLLAIPLNETGAGNLCFPQLVLPSGLPIQEGTQASIQFATSNPKNGEGLYNCADITFSANATLLPSDQCVNSTTITVNSLFSSASVSSSNATCAASGAATASSTAKASSAMVVAPSFFGLLLCGLLAASL